MPSLLGTTVTTNYLKTAPSTQFGTRELTFLKVVATGSNGSTAVDFTTTSTASNSDFSKAVRTVQNFNEIYAVGTPDATGFIVVIADDTKNGADSGNTQGTGHGLLEAALVSALAKGGSATATVTELTFDGVAIS
jgi:hypothetical protein